MYTVAYCIVVLASISLFMNVHGLGTEKGRSSTVLSRRTVIVGTQIFGLVGLANNVEASYSAYAARERDWEERNRNGGAQVSRSQSEGFEL